MAKKKWLARTLGRLLPVAHHHFVFTIASELRVLWLANRRAMERILFSEVKATLRLMFAERYKGARPGIIAVHHSWGRSLALHPHLHLVVTRGGVDDRGRWQGPPRNRVAVLPAEKVSARFRDRFCRAVHRALLDGTLVVPRDADLSATLATVEAASRKNWSVFIGHAGARAETVINYLGRYVAGGPIGNGRILALSHGKATFLFRDYRVTDVNGRAVETPMSLDQAEFLRRWVQHIPLPFSKMIRSFGLYSPAYKGPVPVLPRTFQTAELPSTEQQAPMDVMRCSECGSPLVFAGSTHSSQKRAPPLGRVA